MEEKTESQDTGNQAQERQSGGRALGLIQESSPLSPLDRLSLVYA